MIKNDPWTIADQRTQSRYVVNEWIHQVWPDKPANQIKVNAQASDIVWEMTVDHHKRMTEMETGFCLGTEHVMEPLCAHYVMDFIGLDDVPTVVSFTLDSSGKLWYVAERSGGVRPVEVKTLAQKNN